METKPASDTDKTDSKNDPLYATGVAEFLRRYTPHKEEGVTDLLDKRYRILLASPLPDFNTATAQAVAVEDTKEPERQLFALVCAKGTVQRGHVIDILKNLRHPNIMSLIAAGAVEFAGTREERFVIVYERPAGQKLSALLAAQAQPLNESFIRERIIAPICSALQLLNDNNIAHGRINPDNIYFGNAIILGDCVSEPCGLSQPFYFEPMERIQANPYAKGESNGNQDYYALAILTMYALFGAQHFAPYTPENILRLFLRDGELAALTRNRDYPEVFYEFFRGLVAQNSEERWNHRFLKPWLEGKRFNIISTAAAADTSRPFDTGNIQISSKRALAHILHTNLDEMRESLENGKLSHWTALYLRNKDIADSLNRIGRILASPARQQDSTLYELLMRAILLLDPGGPIRFKSLSMYPDGIGSLCVHLTSSGAQEDLQLLMKFIGFSMVDLWMETQRGSEDLRLRGRDYIPTPAISNAITQLDRLRQYIRNNGLGFGIERTLYDLNPSLPCLSPMLARWHVTTIPELLRRLDELAPQLSASDEPIDKHIAAFIASKLMIQHEFRLHALEAVPTMASHRGLMALGMIAKAHERTNNIKLQGLTHWLALRILPALDTIKSRSRRNRLKTLLTDEAHTGRPQQMAEALVGNNYAGPDKQGFQEALTLYQRNAKRIEYFRDEDVAAVVSELVGARIAQFISYIVLTISVVMALRGMDG